MDVASSKNKKHKKKHKIDMDKKVEDVSHSSISQCVSPNTEKKKKKNKSKDRINDEEFKLETDTVNGIQKDTFEPELTCNEKSKKKKKKHRKNSDCDNEINNEKICVDNSAPENTSDVANNDDNHSKKKKSKKRKHESDTSQEGLKQDLVESVEHSEGKKAKKKKKDLNHVDYKEVNVSREEDEPKDEVADHKTKKKKKKKNKRKDQDKESNEIEIDSTKKSQESNVDEGVKIGNRLEKEDDKKANRGDNSNGSEAINSFNKTNKNESVKSGQWSSVELGDSDRQNKFFRLLGGFKKGSDSSKIQNKFTLGKKPVFGSNANGPKKTGGNFAMNKRQQDDYTKALENEYDRAMGMNLNRGIGLGFEKPPEEGKKFYIDAKSSKSIKFDD